MYKMHITRFPFTEEVIKIEGKKVYIENDEEKISSVSSIAYDKFDTIVVVNEVGEIEIELNKQQCEILLAARILEWDRVYYGIGNHVSKKENFYKTISLIDNKVPLQIFLGNPKGKAMGKITDSDAEKTRNFIRKSGKTVFAHSQYIINLCRSNDWNTDLLDKNLQNASILGLSGVVVHVGKYVDMEPEDAKTSMRENLGKCLGYSTSDCRILLETPAGQGTELLTEIKDFRDFINSFPKDAGIGICIDTCHVFALGYDPFQYIRYIHKKCNHPIALVHYNDSLEPCGSNKDRHKIPYLGCIGKRLEKVAKFCLMNGIPMIHEPKI